MNIEIVGLERRFSVDYEGKKPTDAELGWLIQSLLAWQTGNELPSKPKEQDAIRTCTND